MSARTRVLIVDDYLPLLEICRGLLQPEFEVVGLATDAVLLLDLVKILKPDVVVLDVNLPKCDGLLAGNRLRSKYPDVKLVYFTADESAATASAGLRNGAYACVLKSRATRDLPAAIRSAMAGVRCNRWLESTARIPVF